MAQMQALDASQWGVRAYPPGHSQRGWAHKPQRNKDFKVRVSEAAPSVSPGAPTPSRCIWWTVAGVLGQVPLGMQSWALQQWGLTLCPWLHMGQVWPFYGGQLFAFQVFCHQLILIQCQLCDKNYTGYLQPCEARALTSLFHREVTEGR